MPTLENKLPEVLQRGRAFEGAEWRRNAYWWRSIDMLQRGRAFEGAE